MNNIIKLAFITTVALSAVACGDKTPDKTTTNPPLDALEKAKQVEGIMKKEEATQKQVIDAK